jgi:hypothetical protein
MSPGGYVDRLLHVAQGGPQALRRVQALDERKGDGLGQEWLPWVAVRARPAPPKRRSSQRRAWGLGQQGEHVVLREHGDAHTPGTHAAPCSAWTEGLKGVHPHKHQHHLYTVSQQVPQCIHGVRAPSRPKEALQVFVCIQAQEHAYSLRHDGFDLINAVTAPTSCARQSPLPATPEARRGLVHPEMDCDTPHRSAPLVDTCLGPWYQCLTGSVCMLTPLSTAMPRKRRCSEPISHALFGLVVCTCCETCTPAPSVCPSAWDTVCRAP